jgi:ATP-dependent protease Clp ATPase subunit
VTGRAGRLTVTEAVHVSDEQLENAIKHHRDKIKNPHAIRALIDQYLVRRSLADRIASVPPDDARKIPQSERAAFLVALAKL